MTHVKYVDEAGNFISSRNIYEPVNYGDEDPSLNGLKPSAAYDYNVNTESYQKWKDDLSFVGSYGSWSPLSYIQAWNILRQRDDLAPEQELTNEDFGVLASIPIFLLPGRLTQGEFSVGTYKQGSGHFSTSKKLGPKNPAPLNGQLSLDNSIIYKSKQNGQRRIGRQGDGFVIFDQEGLNANFHGHVRKWEELDQDMKNFLFKEGYTTRKGKWIDK